MNKRKLILAGIGIFLAGVLAGGAGMGLYAKLRLAPLTRMDKVGPSGFFLERMDSALKLSPGQREAIRPIIVDVLAKMREVREPCMPAEEKALGEGAARIREHLDPGQQEKFTRFIEKAMERRKRLFGH